MDLKPTLRGFLNGIFKDKYGSECSIQESSAASESCIWLGVDKPFDGEIGTRMHLTQPMVANLLPLLQHFVEKGYLPPSNYLPNVEDDFKEQVYFIIKHNPNISFPNVLMLLAKARFSVINFELYKFLTTHDAKCSDTIRELVKENRVEIVMPNYRLIVKEQTDEN